MLEKLPVTLVHEENYAAEKPGEFRIVLLIDSESYRVGEDQPNLQRALEVAQEQSGGEPVQIYDHAGNPQIDHKKK